MTRYLHYVKTIIGPLLIMPLGCSASTSELSANEKTDKTIAIPAEVKFCKDCPTFVNVPKPPGSGRQIAYVSKFELTWNNYLAAYDAGRCNIPTPNSGHKHVAENEENDLLPNIERLRLDWPVGELGEADVQCYVSWLQEKTDYQVALPTGVEWEWFARAGRSGIKFPWGNDPDKDREALKGSLVDRSNEGTIEYAQGGKYQTGVKVGLFPPNPWGIYDLMGNLRELTADIIPGEVWYQKHKDSKFAQYTRDKANVLLKGSDRYSSDWVSNGIDEESFAIIWDRRRYSTSVGVRLVLIERH